MLIAGIFLIGTLNGCQSVTGAIYGPGMTPDQLRDAVYEDAYAIGSIRASGASKDQIDKYLIEAEMVMGIDDPRSYFTVQFLKALKNGDQKNAFIFYTARRLYDRTGATLLSDGMINTDALDMDLFHHAVDAYIAGLKGQ
jgi:hypothetical protein